MSKKSDDDKAAAPTVSYGAPSRDYLTQDRKNEIDRKRLAGIELTPLEKYTVVVFESLGLRGYGNGQMKEPSLKLTIKLANAIKEFWLDTRQDSSTGSGYDNGKTEVLEDLWMEFEWCHEEGVAPPAELVDALRVCLDLDERDRAFDEENRAFIGRNKEMWAVIEYDLKHLHGTQKQAADALGLSRVKVQRLRAEFRARAKCDSYWDCIQNDEWELRNLRDYAELDDE